MYISKGTSILVFVVLPEEAVLIPATDSCPNMPDEMDPQVTLGIMLTGYHKFLFICEHGCEAKC